MISVVNQRGFTNEPNDFTSTGYVPVKYINQSDAWNQGQEKQTIPDYSLC